jgi:PhzF family phenazine biosynthesis protein
MCGHATLASGHVVLGQGDADAVSFRTRKAGVLTVTRKGDGYALDLPVTRVARRDNAALLAALGCDGEVFESVSGAEETAIVLLDSEAALRALAPDMRALAQIELMAIVTAPAADGTGAAIASRVFVPAWGVDEDPVTGSAHAALTPFWAERLGRAEFEAVQASARGGRMTCRLTGDRAILGGRCITVIEGVMRI